VLEGKVKLDKERGGEAISAKRIVTRDGEPVRMDRSLRQKSVLPGMHTDMSKETKQEVLARLRRQYVKAGLAFRRQLLDQAVGLLGYHRKSAIRALRAKGSAVKAVAILKGRPKEYDPQKLVPLLKPIWLAAFQPCGRRLRALLPEWLPAYEQDHRRLDADLRQSLLVASARTLDRLIAPLRVQVRPRCGTRPGSLLRQSIPIRGIWEEQGAGWLEIDTVALCGGRLDDCHLWMLDGVDIQTDWTEQRAQENRGQHCTLTQIRDVEESLPFPLLGVDTDNGGEFINHHLVRYLQLRSQPVVFTRAQAYRKNDNAHVEQRNWTHVRQHFGYERYDNPAVVPMINLLCKGPLGQLQNHFLPTQKLESKRRLKNRTVRIYGAPQTPYRRVLAAQEVTAETKAKLQQLHRQLNPFQLQREIQRQKDRIEERRLLRA